MPWDITWISHLLEDGEVYVQLPDGKWTLRGPLGLKTKFGYIRENKTLDNQLEKYREEIVDVAAVYTYIIHTWGNTPITDEELESVIEWVRTTPHWRRVLWEEVLKEV